MKSILDKPYPSVGFLFFLVFISFLSVSSLSHAFPAPKFQEAVVWCSHDGDDNIRTTFFSIISGPSPLDVTSFTATGPSGTFNLTSSLSIKEMGLYYRHIEDGVIADGTYTFQVTDSAGRTAKVVREFSYNGTLPEIDRTTMSPSHGQYIGTTTPTLSFTAPAGGVYFSVIVYDADTKAVWYRSPIKTSTSFELPTGLLQSNTAYKWYARVWDKAENPGNRNSTASCYFYTGTKDDPKIDFKGILSFPSAGNLVNFPFGRGINVAPWDVDYFRLTGPNSTVLDISERRYYGFQISAYNAMPKFLDPPTQSIPDGTYTIEVADKSGKMAISTVEYAYNQVSDFSSDSRVPADNEYFDTTTPSFSWSRITGDPGDGTYRYSLRIADYGENLRWYNSSYSSDISFTLPANLNLPKGSSYKWQVDVYGPAGSGGTDKNNWRCSTSRTFTINGPVCFVNKDDDNCGGKNPCYTSISTAINEAATGTDIRIAGGTYSEEIALNASKTLTLQGGWDDSFEEQNEITILQKAPSVQSGALTLQTLTIKPE
jgi:hypothetical protein